MRWLIFVLCIGRISSKSLDVIDDMSRWLDQNENEKKNSVLDRSLGVTYDICSGVRSKVRCNARIIIDKLLVLSELAGHSVSRGAVQERTELIGDDIHRIANRTKYPIQIDFDCFQKSICSVDEVGGFGTVAKKTRQLINNIKVWDRNNIAHQKQKVEDSEYLGLENEAAFLDALDREFRRTMLRRRLLNLRT